MPRTGRSAVSTTSRSSNGPPEVLRLIKRISVLFRESLDEQLHPLGITIAQLQVLAALSDPENLPGKSGAQISRFCQITPQSTHALLSAAERLGWVVRAPHPENAHTLIASLTPAGRRVFSRGRGLALKLQSQMLRSLSAAEVRRLEATLATLIANLDEMRTQPTPSGQRSKR